MARDSKALYIAFASLLGLLVATVGLNFVPFGAAHLWVGLGIAFTKTIIVVVIFMGLAKSSGSTRLAAGASLLWLSFALILVMADYVTRGWDETQEHGLETGGHYTSYDRVEYSAEHRAARMNAKAKNSP